MAAKWSPRFSRQSLRWASSIVPKPSTQKSGLTWDEVPHLDDRTLLSIVARPYEAFHPQSSFSSSRLKDDHVLYGSDPRPVPWEYECLSMRPWNASRYISEDSCPAVRLSCVHVICIPPPLYHLLRL